MNVAAAAPAPSMAQRMELRRQFRAARQQGVNLHNVMGGLRAEGVASIREAFNRHLAALQKTVAAEKKAFAARQAENKKDADQWTVDTKQRIQQLNGLLEGAKQKLPQAKDNNARYEQFFQKMKTHLEELNKQYEAAKRDEKNSRYSLPGGKEFEKLWDRMAQVINDSLANGHK